MALLAPGWERDYHGSPAFHPTGCLARLDAAQWRPDDCYDLTVTGLYRVRLGRVSREYPYRAAAVSPWPHEPFTDSDPLVELERKALRDAYSRLRNESGAVPADQTLPLEVLANTVCTELALDGELKMALLELDSVIERARQIREHIERNLGRRKRPREGGERN